MAFEVSIIYLLLEATEIYEEPVLLHLDSAAKY